ncbi:exonuclease [Gordonia phage Gsput1]|uniref:PD-(D/E)XK endonuclease-like domain-containing protein n=1 Tax=Gordonia phage Gsput1 TaxID=1622193 RepID=A0A0E3T6Z8_9CAUD|nr:exonuclease [Gordonia phage Gsput1]AKC03064.1 hypothetical protein Gsput1_39 [Gordonia phage Gsput1]
MTKVSMTATVPVAQYANLQPSIEFEVPEGMSRVEALRLALDEIRVVWDAVGREPLKVRDAVQSGVVAATVDLVCWASGTTVAFDPVSHTYGDGSWLSGSVFAHEFTPEFASETVAGKVAAKAGGIVEPHDVLDMWALNADVSTTFGSAVHAALELRGKFGYVSRATKDGSVEAAVTKNPTLRPIVEKFFAGREGVERAVYEAFIADPVLKHCGQIDRLRIMDERNHVRVGDFKTNAELHKKKTVRAPFKGVVESTQLGLYWLQLSFYARILESHGYVVEGLDVHHWNGDEWDHYEHDVVDITPGI